MVVVYCLKSFLPFLDVTVCNMAGAAQGHQIVYGVSEFASTHPTRFYVVDVNGFTLTYLAGDEVSC